LSLYLCPPLYM